MNKIKEQRRKGRRRVQLVRAFTKMGAASRSQARQYILDGRVTVNGKVVRHILEYVDLFRDDIRLDGQSLSLVREHTYLLLNKPRGYVTTRKDPEGRPTIYDLLPPLNRWIFPVGRLDMDSEGLLLLTDDGALSDFLTEPEHHIPKRYKVLIDRPPAEQDRRRLESGVRIRGYLTKPCRVKRIGPDEAGYWISITLTEGKNRQIRLMLDVLGYRVLRLIRTHIGPLAQGELQAGEWRYLRKKEIEALKSLQIAAASRKESDKSNQVSAI
ncbi:MAG: rRNA pseudouridine synthase [candidate division KSB1 bacterium]|nr:rRNA pseudouridine synthase [candidate division KSB1 bacterium]